MMSTPHNAGSEDPTIDSLLDQLFKDMGDDPPIELDPASPARLECPICHSPEVLPIVYGFPSGETLDKELQGLLESGGCGIGAERWRCSSCRHGWGNWADKQTRLEYGTMLAWIDKHYVPLSDEAREAKLNEIDDRIKQMRAQRAELNKGRVPSLVQIIETRNDKKERLASVQQLAEIGPQSEGAVLLLGLLTNDDGQFPWRVFEALHSYLVGDEWIPQVIQVLSLALKDHRKKIRSRAIAMLGRLGRKALPALPAVKEALADTDFHVRSNAEELMRWMERWSVE